MNPEHSASKGVRLAGVTVHYRDVVAANNVCLEVQPGEVLALLGPSGCGKTTLLRSVGGFVPHGGEIYVGDVAVGHVPSHRRNMGMVFQDYALFPHMTIEQNIGFGLRMRRLDRQEIAQRVAEAAQLVGLEGLIHRMPRQLSGGQQQRVALARALVIRPAVLLLDEPLSALDRKLREEMRVELKRIQRVTGVTTIFVTHDQDEALALADRLAVMYQGGLLQCDSPEHVYRRPATPFVAEFLGATNIADGVCREVDECAAVLEVKGAGRIRTDRRQRELTVGQNVKLYIRPQQTRIAPRMTGEQADRLAAKVSSKSYLGKHIEFEVQLGNGTRWAAHVTDEGALAALDVGAEVSLAANPSHVIVFADASDKVTLSGAP